MTRSLDQVDHQIGFQNYGLNTSRKQNDKHVLSQDLGKCSFHSLIWHDKVMGFFSFNTCIQVWFNDSNKKII
jgi:hypothetical protein